MRNEGNAKAKDAGERGELDLDLDVNWVFPDPSILQNDASSMSARSRIERESDEMIEEKSVQTHLIVPSQSILQQDFTTFHDIHRLVRSLLTKFRDLVFFQWSLE